MRIFMIEAYLFLHIRIPKLSYTLESFLTVLNSCYYLDGSLSHSRMICNLICDYMSLLLEPIYLDKLSVTFSVTLNNVTSDWTLIFSYIELLNIILYYIITQLTFMCYQWWFMWSVFICGTFQIVHHCKYF